MSIKHDDQWIQEQLTDGPGWHYLDYHVEMVAKGYFEHMMHWRPLEELPEIGQRIEIAWHDKSGANGDWSTVDDFDGDYDADFTHAVCGTPYAWRPAGELPE